MSLPLENNTSVSPPLIKSINASILQKINSIILNSQSCPVNANNTPNVLQDHKIWHNQIASDLRSYLIEKITTAMIPICYDVAAIALYHTPNSELIQQVLIFLDNEMKQQLKQLAKTVEHNTFHSAYSKSEYFHSLAEILYKLRHKSSVIHDLVTCFFNDVLSALSIYLSFAKNMSGSQENIKGWHKQMNNKLREDFIQKLKKPFSFYDNCIEETRVDNNFSSQEFKQTSIVNEDLEPYWKKIESDTFYSANSKSEYYDSLAGKYYSIQQEIYKREQRNKRTAGIPNSLKEDLQVWHNHLNLNTSEFLMQKFIEVTLTVSRHVASIELKKLPCQNFNRERLIFVENEMQQRSKLMARKFERFVFHSANSEAEYFDMGLDAHSCLLKLTDQFVKKNEEPGDQLFGIIPGLS